jgi:hypothetical protein
MTGRKVRSQPLVRSEVELIGSCRLKVIRAGVKGKREIGQATARRRRVAAVAETPERSWVPCEGREACRAYMVSTQKADRR